jgi:hypothetical protein
MRGDGVYPQQESHPFRYEGEETIVSRDDDDGDGDVVNLRLSTAGKCVVYLEARKSHKTDRLWLRSTVRSQQQAAGDVRLGRVLSARSRHI